MNKELTQPQAKSWYDFYKDRDPARYLRYAKKRYAPFIDIIANEIVEGDRVLEAGCGMATITKALDDRGIAADYALLDRCPKMLALAHAQMPSAEIIQGDIRHWSETPVNVIHGHGVLEHFSDAEIRAIIGAHYMTGARTAIHFVPGNKYDKPHYGDERLMKVDDWRRIALPDEVETFNDGFDYALVWRFNKVAN